MNIAIIGSGGGEHSLCYKIYQSKKVKNIYCIPGNAGTKSIAINKTIDINNFNKIYKFVRKNNIKLIVVGPEVPLLIGIVEYFQKKKILIFGPNKFASRLEGSKIFMKKFCNEFNIPSAKYKKIFKFSDAKEFIKTMNLPIVVKSDGLASGKGVTICKTKKKALIDAKKILKGKFKSSRKLVLEEFLDGEEMSYFVITDGYNFKCLGTAQDHKRIGEGDKGLNTGGMGCISPSPYENEKNIKLINKKFIEPTIKAMNFLGYPFKGILYAGLMFTKSDVFLIEYNIRLGDPECQALIARLASNFLDICIATEKQKLKDIQIKLSAKKSVCIVMASKGYPENYKSGYTIKGIEKVNSNNIIFHAGTKLNKNKELVTNGGRVLNIISKQQTLEKAKAEAYKLIKNIKCSNLFYRKDIGD